MSRLGIALRFAYVALCVVLCFDLGPTSGWAAVALLVGLVIGWTTR